MNIQLLNPAFNIKCALSDCLNLTQRVLISIKELVVQLYRLHFNKKYYLRKHGDHREEKIALR
ncbi:MAG TPA: hypothetical protein VFC65_06255, partial [Prolixibacteraceae bacterium]|nr:hypothetical protein [Prolixibacteraceae bacterium]